MSLKSDSSDPAEWDCSVLMEPAQLPRLARQKLVSWQGALEFTLLNASLSKSGSLREREWLLAARELKPAGRANSGWDCETLITEHAQFLPKTVLEDIDLENLQAPSGAKWRFKAREHAMRRFPPGEKVPPGTPLWSPSATRSRSTFKENHQKLMKQRFSREVHFFLSAALTSQLAVYSFTPTVNPKSSLAGFPIISRLVVSIARKNSKNFDAWAEFDVVSGGKMMNFLMTSSGATFFKRKGVWSKLEISQEVPQIPMFALESYPAFLARLIVKPVDIQNVPHVLMDVGHAARVIEGGLVSKVTQAKNQTTATFLRPRHAGGSAAPISGAISLSTTKITVNSELPSLCAGEMRCEMSVAIGDAREADEMIRGMKSRTDATVASENSSAAERDEELLQAFGVLSSSLIIHLENGVSTP